MDDSNNDRSGSRTASQTTLEIGLDHLYLVLAVATGFFTVAGIGIVIAKFTYGFNHMYHLYSLFDLDSDSSVPTWYASLSLLICSILLAFHALVSRRIGDRRFRQWAGLAIIFLVLSVDETARLHEILGGYIGIHIKAWVGQGDGLLNFSWVLPGMLFVAFMAVTYIRFLLSLPRGICYRMILSAVVYVGGALIMEMLNAQTAAFHGSHSLRYQVGTVFEEFLEMAGVVLFAHVLALYLGQRTQGIAITVTPPQTRTSAAVGSGPVPETSTAVALPEMKDVCK